MCFPEYDGIINLLLIFSVKNLTAFNSCCMDFLLRQFESGKINVSKIVSENLLAERIGNSFGIEPFYIEMGSSNEESPEFSFSAPTTAFNTLRLLRGMQLNKAILLEGSPGVGKTSLVIALAKCTKNKILRVNLSDQTVSNSV